MLSTKSLDRLAVSSRRLAGHCTPATVRLLRIHIGGHTSASRCRIVVGREFRIADPRARFCVSLRLQLRNQCFYFRRHRTRMFPVDVRGQHLDCFLSLSQSRERLSQYKASRSALAPARDPPAIARSREPSRTDSISGTNLRAPSAPSKIAHCSRPRALPLQQREHNHCAGNTVARAGFAPADSSDPISSPPSGKSARDPHPSVAGPDIPAGS